MQQSWHWVDCSNNHRDLPSVVLTIVVVENMGIIFHITRREAWDKAEAEGAYRSESFPTEGFIHCSTSDQVVQVANIRFRGQGGLVLLGIDTERVLANICYENLEGGEQMFPHIYGEINIDAVMRVWEFEPGGDGYFSLPSVSA